MRIVFAGTPEFARLAYVALLEAGHEVPLVLTQPDRPAGRGMKLKPSPVKEEAIKQGATVVQPLGLRLDGKYAQDAKQVQIQLESVQADVMVVAAYGLILPQWVLDMPHFGCLNIHASLLPRWRGAAPIQRAIEAGDSESGVCIMQMDAGLDTGDILLYETVGIGQKNASQLHDVLANLGSRLIVKALSELEEGGELHAQKQPDDGVTYAAKIEKAEAVLDLEKPASLLERKIRAFNPVPGANLMLPNLKDPVKVWQAIVMDKEQKPTNHQPVGSILSVSADGIDLQTGQGILRLLELQKAGSKRQPVQAFVTGWRLSCE